MTVLPPNKEEAIWNVALECALRRQNKTCRNKFGCHKCNSCPFDVRQYGTFEPQEVNLYMIQANSEAWRMRDKRRSSNMNWFFLLLAIAGVIFLVYSCMQDSYRRNSERNRAMGWSFNTQCQVDATYSSASGMVVYVHS